MQDSKSVAALQRVLERAITAAAGTPTTVSNLTQLAGGASQESWALDIESAGGVRQALVLRRDLGGALSSVVLPREQEFFVQKAMHAVGLPVPRPYWFIPDLRDEGNGPPRAAFLMERIEGETLGRRIVQIPTLTEARARLPEQMGRTLAAIHNIDPTTHGLHFLRAPAPGESAVEARLKHLEADLRLIDEPHPALELGFRWLRAHAPTSPRLVPVHGDYRVGNFIVGPEGLRAVLDWENLHMSDPHADLAWLCLRVWRFGQDHLSAGGVCARELFFNAYEAASGHPVDRWRAFYWEVLGNLQWAIGSLGQAQRHLSGHAPSIELASLGRISAEMEWELLHLIEQWEQKHTECDRAGKEVRDAG